MKSEDLSNNTYGCGMSKRDENKLRIFENLKNSKIKERRSSQKEEPMQKQNRVVEEISAFIMVPKTVNGLSKL